MFGRVRAFEAAYNAYEEENEMKWLLGEDDSKDLDLQAGILASYDEFPERLE